MKFSIVNEYLTCQYWLPKINVYDIELLREREEEVDQGPANYMEQVKKKAGIVSYQKLKEVAPERDKYKTLRQEWVLSSNEWN